MYGNVSANTLVGPGKITFVENGWYGEGFVIHLSQDGPTGCPAGRSDFAIDKNHPTYKELVSIALAGFTSEAMTQLVVEEGTCFMGRTKILSIRLLK